MGRTAAVALVLVASVAWSQEDDKLKMAEKVLLDKASDVDQFQQAVQKLWGTAEGRKVLVKAIAPLRESKLTFKTQMGSPPLLRWKSAVRMIAHRAAKDKKTVDDEMLAEFIMFLKAADIGDNDVIEAVGLLGPIAGPALPELRLIAAGRIKSGPTASNKLRDKVIAAQAQFAINKIEKK